MSLEFIERRQEVAENLVPLLRVQYNGFAIEFYSTNGTATMLQRNLDRLFIDSDSELESSCIRLYNNGRQIKSKLC